MSESLTVFTTLTPSYKFSSELRLCFKMFKKALPENSFVFIAENDDESRDVLKTLIIENISNAAPYILIVKEPALLIKKGNIDAMLHILETCRDIWCVLPSDIRGYRHGRASNYYTLRSFELFSDSLIDPENPIMPYDGRDPWMFLIKKAVLHDMEIPEEPLNIPRILPAENTCIALNAYIHPFINYYGEIRPDVLKFIPADIKSLLDVGCSRGKFGALIRKKIGCRVVGVEMNSYEAMKGKVQLDRVIEGDFLTIEIDEKFDCLTCLDVIEHIAEPDIFLQKVRDLLNDNGYLIMSIPNIGHWSIIEDLLVGRWDYVPAGILCVSHLRFFTKNTILSLLEDNGFRIVTIEQQLTSPQEKIRNIFSILKKNGIEINEESLSCLGYYIVVQKTG